MRTRFGVLALAVLAARSGVAQEHMHMADSMQWSASAHATAFVQYVGTFGTRATSQVGSVNRLMVEGGGPWAGGALRVHAMVSAEPLTLSERGTPQPLQVAFTTAGGTVTDHAHPSPWIMELAASYERTIAGGVVATIYGGAIGDPALGPPVYLHRASAAANPVVPLGHHGQDVTHSSFGVVTLGARWRGVHLEGSAFNDRQSDDPATVFSYAGARINAYAGRATLAVGKGWALFTTYGYLPASTGGHSHETQHRIGAGALRDGPQWAVSLVYGADDPVGNVAPHRTLLVEAQRTSRGGHVLFGRAEFVQRTAEELSLVGSVDSVQDIGALLVGYGRAVATRRGMTARIGAYATLNVIPAQLELFYGSRTPLALAAYGQVSWSSAHR